MDVVEKLPGLRNAPKEKVIPTLLENDACYIDCLSFPAFGCRTVSV